MTRTILMTALLTGLFCVGFSLVVGYVALNLSMAVLVALSFVSGFCGSLFAQTVMRRR